MASGAHILQQQKGSLETRIKLLINNDLKEICKAYGYQVSGKKDALQKRCIEILQEIVAHGDENAFQDLNYRVQHHGAAPPQSRSTANAVSSSSNPQQANGGYNNYSSMTPRAPAASRPPSGKNFKPSPFYDLLEAVVPVHNLPESKEMPQNRHTVPAQLTLTADQVARLKADPSLRLMMYCGQTQEMNQLQADIAFPNQLEVKINGDDVRANYKGLKNKPGSTKPADITDKVRKAANYPNKIVVTYALTTKKFAFVVNLARYISAETLTERIRAGRHGGGVIRKEHVLAEMNKANADSDIAATSTRMSLKDPISTLRISLPVRSSRCKHNQCFDAAMFMALQDQAPQWSCPVCSQAITYESLCVDQYFQEILREAEKKGSSIEKVDIEPNGEYRLLSEDDITKPPGHTSKGARAKYDNDFDDDDDDDDLVELDEGRPKPLPISSTFQQPLASLLSPASTSGFVMNTPPLSSRGASAAPSVSSAAQSAKRPASSVIDLTLSDDEDEPPRPAKRQSTSMHHGNPAHYSTPSSLSDHRYPSSYAAGHRQGTDSFRPSSNQSPAVNGTASGANNYTTSQSGNPTFGSGASWRSGSSASASPAYPAYGNTSSEQRQSSASSWTGQQSRPSGAAASIGTNGVPPTFPSFSLSNRPATSASPVPNSNDFRLPPMQTHPDGFSNQWRSTSGGYSDYSQSPPG